jgi:hypothetical protein
MDRRGETMTPRDNWLRRGAPKLPAAVQVEMEVRGRVLSWRLPVACDSAK